MIPDILAPSTEARWAETQNLPVELVPDFDREGQIVDVGTDLGVITKSGTWFSFKDNRLGQGKENVKTYLKENPKFRDELLVLVKKAMADVKNGLAAKKPVDELPGKAPKAKPQIEEVA